MSLEETARVLADAQAALQALSVSINDKQRPTFDDAICIAIGCHDYSGGRRHEELEAFHHGIETVVNALNGAKRNGLSDSQVAVLHRYGRDHQAESERRKKDTPAPTPPECTAVPRPAT